MEVRQHNYGRGGSNPKAIVAVEVIQQGDGIRRGKATVRGVSNTTGLR